MKLHTYRQYRVLVAWLDMEWNKPDRHDGYLMQIACEIRRMFAKHPQNVKMSHFRLKFGGEEAEKKRRKNLTRQQASEESMARWFVGVGLSPDQAKQAFTRSRTQSGQTILPDPNDMRLKD